MPEISRFLGIVIKMFFGDHAPPHFHASYQGTKASFSIENGQVIAGGLPAQQTAVVTTWALLRKKELMANWKALSMGKEPQKIAPLR